MLRIGGFAMLFLLCTAAAPPARTPAVSIVALYRERMALPPGATLEVKLTDADSGRVIASAMLDNPHVPVSIELSYEPSNIDAEHVYTVNARILVDGEPFFVTNTAAKVITQGKPSQVELVLERAPAASPSSLENRQWMLSELSGHAVSAEHRPYLELSAGRASGFGGCNRFSGGYTLRGDSIEFTAAATTMMACVQPGVMETESAFLQTLLHVRYWSAEGSNLELFDSGRRLLLRFEAHK